MGNPAPDSRRAFTATTPTDPGSLHWFDGFAVADFAAALERVKGECTKRLAASRKIYVYLESPCNPHGHVLDVAGISRAAQKEGLTVICDATVGTPFLQPVLRREDPAERPDFVIHSYTKDLAGYGATTAGVVIARNELMFLPKGDSCKGVSWDQTMFWGVYYIKGAFLDVPLGIDVNVEFATGQAPILHFQGADLDDAMPVFGFEAGGFRIENDLPHGLSCSLLSLTLAPF